MMKKLWAPQIDDESKRAYLYLPKHIHKLLTVRRDLIVFWEQEEKHPKKKKNHTQNGPICRQHLPFVLFPLLLSYFVVLDLVITQTIQTPLSLYCFKNSPKNMIPPLLPGKKPKDLSIPQALNHSLTHSLTHVLTHKCFLMSHTSSARWCFLWNKAKIQTWRGSFHHYCQYCQQLTTPARKDNRKKKKRRSSKHTHTHTQREVISNTKDPSQKQCLFF